MKKFLKGALNGIKRLLGMSNNRNSNTAKTNECKRIGNKKSKVRKYTNKRK